MKKGSSDSPEKSVDLYEYGKTLENENVKDESEESNPLMVLFLIPFLIIFFLCS